MTVTVGSRSHLNRRKKNEEYREREHLFLSEVENLLETAKYGVRNGDRDYLIILLMVRHGLRCAECSELKWEQINLKGKSIFVKRKKGGISGTHPLRDDEINILQSWKDTQTLGEKLLFDLSPVGIAKMFERVSKRAGLEIKAHAHMLRHTCGYLLINNGHNSRKVQSYLGHRQFRMTEKYTKMAAKAFDDIDWNNMVG